MSEPSERVDELLWKHLDGALTPDEETELQKLLEEHPEHGRELFALADERLAMEEALRSTATPQTAEDKRAAKRPSSKRIRRPSTHRIRAVRTRRSDLALKAYLSVAACLALAVTAFFVFNRPSTPTTTARPTSPTENPPPVVAQATRAVETVPIAEITLVDAPATPQTTSAVAIRGTGSRKETKALATGLALRDNDRIETGPSRVTIRYLAEATTLDLSAHSVLCIRIENGAKRVLLDQGELTAEVAKQPAGKSFVFATPYADATVLGTRFKLTSEKDSSRLDVIEGSVRFAKGADRAVVVNGGESAIASAADLRKLEVAVAQTQDGLSEKLVPSKGCLWGLSINVRKQGKEDAAELVALEEKLGRKMAIAHQYHAFSDTGNGREFPTACERAWASEGRLLLLSWKPRTGNTQLKWADVAAGKYDAEYVDPTARKLAAWGQSLFFTLHHQPDDDVQADGSGMTAADFVAMWRHVQQRFQAAGAKNVVWVWTVIAGTPQPERWNKLYPGDAYVDWVSCGAYNAGGANWRSLTQATANFYSWASTQFSGDRYKPIMLSCIGCVEDAANPLGKEEWLKGLPAELTAMPNVKAVIYWSSRLEGGAGHSLDSSPGAMAGFRAAGLDPHFNPDLSPQKRR